MDLLPSSGDCSVPGRCFSLSLAPSFFGFFKNPGAIVAPKRGVGSGSGEDRTIIIIITIIIVILRVRIIKIVSNIQNINNI